MIQKGISYLFSQLSSSQGVCDPGWVMPESQIYTHSIVWTWDLRRWPIFSPAYKGLKYRNAS